jgi:lysophospholipase L1-like esterase
MLLLGFICAPCLMGTVQATNAYDIIAIGDSITAGAYEYDYAPIYILRDLCNATVLNKGVGGQTTVDMLARYDTDITANTPKYVVIMAGFNDLGTAGLDNYTGITARLRQMYDKSIDNGTIVVACAITPKAYTLNIGGYDRNMTNAWIMAQTDVIPVDTFTPLYNSTINGLDPLYDPGDHTHLNIAGDQVVAHAIYDAAFANVTFGDVDPIPEPDPEPSNVTDDMSNSIASIMIGGVIVAVVVAMIMRTEF